MKLTLPTFLVLALIALCYGDVAQNPRLRSQAKVVEVVNMIPPVAIPPNHSITTNIPLAWGQSTGQVDGYVVQWVQSGVVTNRDVGTNLNATITTPLAYQKQITAYAYNSSGTSQPSNMVIVGQDPTNIIQVIPMQSADGITWTSSTNAWPLMLTNPPGQMFFKMGIRSWVK